MDTLCRALAKIPEIAELLVRIDGGGCPVALSGVAPIHRAQLAATVREATGRPIVVVCNDEKDARQLAGDLLTLTGKTATVLLSREWQLTAAAASHAWEQNRLTALYHLAKGRETVVIATADALLQRCLPEKVLKETAFSLKVGGRADLNALSQQLVAGGYRRADTVEGMGQFALRGGILDVFSPGMEQPVRCEFFDDEIDSIGSFDTGTQRRVKNIKSARILPAAEVLPAYAPGGVSGLAKMLTALADKLSRKKETEKLCATLRQDGELLENRALPGGMDRYFGAVYPEFTTPLSYLPADAVVFLSESGRLEEKLKASLWQHRQDVETLLKAGVLAGDYARLSLTAEELYAGLADFPVCMTEALPTSRYPLRPKELLTLTAKQLSSYGGSLEAAVSDLEHYQRQGTGVIVLCGSESKCKNLLRLLDEREIPAVSDLSLTALPKAGEIRIGLGALSAGAEYPQLRLAILTEGQLLSPLRKKQREKKPSNRQKIQSYTDLTPGDLVVHVHHGVGRFAGIQRMPVDGVEKDYIKIDYLGGDCLYVPATQLDLVSKFIGGGEEQEHTRLNKLGGTEWAKAKTRAKAAAKDLAKGLIALYAQRQKQVGFAFSPDSPWQQEFEEAFDYAETDDQLRCIAEIKGDMERPRPMDRLLCGDVGYGKTEVALRAVMKCVLDGKQAAILVPTTVLAQQHYATATNRFRSFPLKIAVLSRFQTSKATKQTLADVAAGQVDLLIGTHKLLQKNVQFHDLGLLVIDEEQRFGVTHKERLKEMSRQVDVLTLTATPIPRTLNMALSGIRDMSTIEEPPVGRQPVQTYVLEHDWTVLEDACRRELDRGGQVYYLHNRVETIDLTASRLQKLMGEDVRIVVGHGRMNESQLSAAMGQMVDGSADIFVCTTIIETGIDIPNVNTLIIEDADHLGLAQLHQIRGRIGRSSRRAYAYMTFRRGKTLSETAEKRLSAIREYVEFGSGFKIAMRDLEIRGAGNLLGPEQSGYMMSVGYDMYLKLLEEAVIEEQGGEKKITTECAADLTISANIPDRYVPSPEQRMDLYRRIAAIRTQEDSGDLLDEMIDRYGEPPKPVLALLDVALLRAAAAGVGVGDISQKGEVLRLQLAQFDPEALGAVCSLPKYRRLLTLSAGETPALSLRLRPGGDVLQTALDLVEELGLHGKKSKE
ncbi:MAG: transcription-repair coupling factor [Oscillospiraceae bacterium]